MFNFPSSPYVNQQHTINGVKWMWNGVAWDLIDTYVSVQTLKTLVGEAASWEDFKDRVSEL